MENLVRRLDRILEGLQLASEILSEVIQDEQKIEPAGEGMVDVCEKIEESHKKMFVKISNSVVVNVSRENRDNTKGRRRGEYLRAQHDDLLFYFSTKTNVILNQFPGDKPDIREIYSLLFRKKLLYISGSEDGWQRFEGKPGSWEGRGVKIKCDKEAFASFLDKTTCPDPGGGNRRGLGIDYWWEGGMRV